MNRYNVKVFACEGLVPVRPYDSPCAGRAALHAAADYAAEQIGKGEADFARVEAHPTDERRALVCFVDEADGDIVEFLALDSNAEAPTTPTAPSFQERLPKRGVRVSLMQLQEAIRAGSVPTGVKQIDAQTNTWIVYMPGQINFYMTGSEQLFRVLVAHNVRA